MIEVTTTCVCANKSILLLVFLGFRSLFRGSNCIDCYAHFWMEMASYIVIYSAIHFRYNNAGLYILHYLFTHIIRFCFTILSIIVRLQWLPESMVFDMTNGRTDLALSTLERVAKENKKSLPLGRLVMDRFYQASHGRFKDVLSKEMCKTSALLWLVW